MKTKLESDLEYMGLHSLLQITGILRENEKLYLTFDSPTLAGSAHDALLAMLRMLTVQREKAEQAAKTDVVGDTKVPAE